MKHNKFSEEQKQRLPGGSRLTAAQDFSQNEIDFVPSPDEVARRACFSYVNQGLSSGHQVQHWLKAEAELIAERKRTRAHNFHNQT
jgi:Protein of unknown function (DUF2934)